MAPHPKHPGIDVRSNAANGQVSETFTVRWREPDGRRPRRTFDTLPDALDFRAKHQSARRWRPEELRQENAGRRTLDDFFAEWWLDHAMVELKRSTLATYRCMWETHLQPRVGALPMRDIDARRVVTLRRDLLESGAGPTSVVKALSLLQRVFRDAAEYGEVAYNPVKAVRKPSPGPTREAQPLTPDQVERLAADLRSRGQEQSSVLVRLMAYTGLRPQEALALHWYAVRSRTLLVELANADGELDRLKNRKRSRRRSRTVELLKAVQADLHAWREHCSNPDEAALLFPHERHGHLWSDEHYRNWRRRIYVPAAKRVGLPTTRPYDLRHTWTSLRISEQKLSIVELAEQLGDRTSTVLDVYSHVIGDWRGRGAVNIEREIQKARRPHHS